MHDIKLGKENPRSLQQPFKHLILKSTSTIQQCAICPLYNVTCHLPKNCMTRYKLTTDEAASYKGDVPSKAALAAASPYLYLMWST